MLGVGEFLVAAVVAAGVDEFRGGGEVGGGGGPRILCFAEEKAGAVEVEVGQEKFHGAALGDFPRFVQILLRALGAGLRAGEAPLPGAGEESFGKLVALAGPAEAGDGGVQLRSRRGDEAEVGRGGRAIRLPSRIAA